MSWLSGLIPSSSASASASQFAPAGGQEVSTFSEVQDYVPISEGRVGGKRFRSDVQSMEEAEDMRSPYWHVSQQDFKTGARGADVSSTATDANDSVC